MRPCAANYSGRIELAPSRLAAAVWFCWLAFACGVVLFAVALPWVLRLVLCLFLVAPGIFTVRRFILLAGPNAVRAIEWSAAGEFIAWVGPTLARQPAALRRGSFRLGTRAWVLSLATPLGRCPVLVAASEENNLAFRRLSRCLTLRLRRASGRCSRPAVTIRPNV
jgi:hypothetical protein